MSRSRTGSFPPGRLRALSAERLTWIRVLWFVALALAMVLDIAGAAVRNSARRKSRAQSLAARASYYPTPRETCTSRSRNGITRNRGKTSSSGLVSGST